MTINPVATVRLNSNKIPPEFEAVDEQGEAIQSIQTLKIGDLSDLSAGALPLGVKTDLIYNLPLMVMLSVREISFSLIGDAPVCVCLEQGDVQITEGRPFILDMPASDQAYLYLNPEHGGYDADHFRCDLPCPRRQIAEQEGDQDVIESDGSEDIEEGVDQQTEEDTPGDTDDPAEDVEPDVVEEDAEEPEEEEELPVGVFFDVQAEDAVNTAGGGSDPVAQVTLFSDDSSEIPFFGDVVILGEFEDPAQSRILPDHKLVFDFQVQMPGLYFIKIYYPAAKSFGRAKAYIDGEPLTQAPWDIDMFQNYPPDEFWPYAFMRKGADTLGNDQVFLDVGPHQLELRVAEKRVQATNYRIGVDRIMFVP